MAMTSSGHDDVNVLPGIFCAGKPIEVLTEPIPIAVASLASPPSKELFMVAVLSRGSCARVAEGALIKYRPDIDGLRALAVIPVLLFHADFKPFGGGFVGVDVFFVISGYLITSVIAQDIRNSQFSVAKFYERRIRRIFPALFAVLLFCFLVSFLLFMPLDFRRVGASAVAMTLFASNVLFWRLAGYFDAGADLKPLLHTWSLAVEEQYYVVFPLFMAIVSLFARRALLASILIALSALSFGWSIIHLQYDPAGSFYLPGGRAWELLLGAIIAICVDREP